MTSNTDCNIKYVSQGIGAVSWIPSDE